MHLQKVLWKLPDMFLNLTLWNQSEHGQGNYEVKRYECYTHMQTANILMKYNSFSLSFMILLLVIIFECYMHIQTD